MKTIIMPQVGQDIPSAAIVEWLKQEGDLVKKGEVVLVIESDKATFDIEAEADGVLLKALYNAGDVVEILKPVGYIGQPGELIETQQKPEAEAPVSSAPQPARNETATAPAPDGHVHASPSVRRLAREKGVDLSQLTGSGPGGRIVVKDVLAMLDLAPSNERTAETSAQAASVAEEKVEVFSKLRKRIAERLSHSTRTIPHFYLFLDVDMTRVVEWREQWNASAEVKVSITDLIIQATAKSLRSFPRANAHCDGEKLALKKDINIGLAVAIDEGLLVPVLPKADQLNLDEIARQTRKMIEAARRGAIESSTEGSFTITSLGMYGIQRFLPIINPPETAILAVGAIEPRLIPVDKSLQIRQMMTLTLGADHRAFDGAYGAQFLNSIKHELESAW